MSDTYILYNLTGAEAIDPSSGIDYTVNGNFIIAYMPSGAVDFDVTSQGPGYDMTITYGGNTYPTYLSSFTANSAEFSIGGSPLDNSASFFLDFPILDPHLIISQSLVVLANGDQFNFDFGGNLVAIPVCFCPGTLITTANGPKAVEALQPGDLILTDAGDYLPALWIGRQTIDLRGRDPLRTAPIKIAANAILDGLPIRDLTCSPSHAFLIDGVLVEAGAMVNGTTITYVEGAETVTYLHVELETHALLFAEGMLAESFVDTIERHVFDNTPIRHEPIVEMDYPRARSGRQLPAALRCRLRGDVDERPVMS